MRILIVHGWLHSAQIYRRLGRDLHRQLGCKVELYELAGYGQTRVRYHSNIIKKCALDLQQHLEKYDYDVVIAHSLGGNLVLRAVDRMMAKPRLILLSPAYHGITLMKPITPLAPLLAVGLAFLKLPFRINRFLIKLVARLTINNWSKIDDSIIRGTKSVNVLVAVLSIFELAFSPWRVRSKWQTGSVCILWGEYDHVVQKSHMLLLKRDIGRCKLVRLSKVGHTAVLENYVDVFKFICKEVAVSG